MTGPLLDPLDLAALLASKICHDVINPIGAIMNGLEVLEDEKDQETRELALELIRNSARGAAAQLQFCRLAFGGSGSSGGSIDTGDAEEAARGVLVNEKTSLTWEVARAILPKSQVKLILNLCLIGSACIPRGGNILVRASGEGDGFQVEIVARGNTGGACKLPGHIAPLFLGGSAGPQTIDARAVQAYYTDLLAKTAGFKIEIIAESDEVRLMSAPRMANVPV